MVTTARTPAEFAAHVLTEVAAQVIEGRPTPEETLNDLGSLNRGVLVMMSGDRQGCEQLRLAVVAAHARLSQSLEGQRLMVEARRQEPRPQPNIAWSAEHTARVRRFIEWHHQMAMCIGDGEVVSIRSIVSAIADDLRARESEAETLRQVAAGVA